MTFNDIWLYSFFFDVKENQGTDTSTAQEEESNKNHNYKLPLFVQITMDVFGHEKVSGVLTN